MKITWRKNPLETTIELESDLERENLRLRIENEIYSWAVVSAEYSLNGVHRPASASEALNDLELVLNEDKLKQRVDRDLETHLAELGGVHTGDCTCVPCSCSKCHAEGLLGISTIEGLGKHPGHTINSAFDANPSASAAEILIKLANPDYSQPNEHYKGKEELWFSCVPRWTKESSEAHDWLKKYYEDHPEARL